MSTRSFHFKSLFLVTVALVTSSAQAATIRVGADGACQFNNLPAALSAAASNGDSANTIQLARNVSYTNVHVSLNGNKQITIQGGLDDCTSTAISGQTTLDGVGGSGTVLAINMSGGGGVFLNHLRIQGGSEDTGVLVTPTGGGIEILSGDVTLSNTLVTANNSKLGGGVYVQGGGSTLAVLRLKDGSSISANNARTDASAGGGGVYCRSGGFVTLADSIVGNNDSTGDGGGIYLDNCQLSLAAFSPATIGVNLINNAAGLNGGAIFATNRSKIRTQLDGGGATPLPTFVSGNRAGNGGGAFALLGDLTATDAERVEAELRHTRIVGNQASVGGAIFLLQRANFTLTGGAPWVTCSGLGTGNCTQLSNNFVTGGICVGGAVHSPTVPNNIANVPFLGLYGVMAQNNRLQGCAGDGSFLSGNVAMGFANTVITGHAGPSVFRLLSNVAEPTNHNIWFSTISGNSASAIFKNFSTNTDHNISLYGSIVHNSGPVRDVAERVINFNAPASCLPIVNENVSTQGVGDIVDPLLDSSFTPASNSFATDACPSDTTWSPDLYNNARPIDIAGLPNINGPQDRGAVERLDLPEQLFRNGFE
jgi:hypothetical protein